MAHATCNVHQILEGDPDKRVVRIRAEAFRAFQGKRFIVRITSTNGESERKSACFKAEYVDATYRKNISGSDLVFMRKTWRDLLNVHPPDQVELEEIPANDSLYEVHSALSEDRNEGRIYLFNEELHDQIAGKRYIARIKRKKREDAKKRKNGEDAKTIYCEVLYTDDFYLEDWQEKWEQRGTSSSPSEDREKNGKQGDTSPSDFCKLIFISEWYRNLLGIETIREKIHLDVKVLNAEPGGLRESVWEKWALLYLYPRNHPQAVVCTANMIAIIAFGLGVWGIGLGFPGLKDSIGPFWALLGFVVLLVIGLAIIVLGIKGLIRR